ncbi:FAD-dependent monooxygenase [Tateyamaria omphalii]|uniref:FAD-dependent monooxygenase n=1 Tax=Tateyamaria omphalii TaxID=299262 RepID=UPI001C99F3A7|nr:FAD-dependent monooxygenase [Tateyamaria omphalii]MBY5933976.1 FAD-dependent monooxygenase [Tateyamaria omphalii]
MKVLIVGGGIGGLSAAIALRLRGWQVEVFEQASALTEVGAGLQISPNGWRVIDALGVAAHLRATVFEPEAIEMRLGVSGRQVFHLPMKGYAKKRWGAPYLHVHRADLVDALAARLAELAPDAVQTGRAVSAYEPSGEVHLENGDTYSADLVVGADGLHSVIRRQMLGPQSPHYTGNVAWRAVVPLEELAAPPPPTACVWAGNKRHAVTTRLRAGTMANFVGMVEQDEPAPEGWRIEGNRDDALAAFSGWDPIIVGLIERAPVLNRWALFDRAPLPRWHDGRVALLGDAAHPMLPSMAQGAVQALEDAWTLATVLDGAEDVEQALGGYFDQRIERTARIQAGSASNARMFHKASALGRLGFYGPMAIGARLFPDIIHARQDWVYRHDVTGQA